MCVSHVPALCDLLAAQITRAHRIPVSALTDFVLCCGQSEAFAAAIFARKLINPLLHLFIYLFIQFISFHFISFH
jgi:hypothetical protein